MWYQSRKALIVDIVAALPFLGIEFVMPAQMVVDKRTERTVDEDGRSQGGLS